MCTTYTGLPATGRLEGESLSWSPFWTIGECASQRSALLIFSKKLPGYFTSALAFQWRLGLCTFKCSHFFFLFFWEGHARPQLRVPGLWTPAWHLTHTVRGSSNQSKHWVQILSSGLKFLKRNRCRGVSSPVKDLASQAQWLELSPLNASLRLCTCKLSVGQQIHAFYGQPTLVSFMPKSQWEKLKKKSRDSKLVPDYCTHYIHIHTYPWIHTWSP